MIPKLEVTVTRTNGEPKTYPVTPYVIYEWEQMTKLPFLGTFADLASMEAGNLYLVGFLSEREAGVAPLPAWPRDYIRDLAELPSLDEVNPTPPAR